MNGKNNVTSCTKRSLPESIVQILIQPLLFVFIEMVDKYQVLPVAWTNRITTRCNRDS